LSPHEHQLDIEHGAKGQKRQSGGIAEAGKRGGHECVRLGTQGQGHGQGHHAQDGQGKASFHGRDDADRHESLEGRRHHGSDDQYLDHVEEVRRGVVERDNQPSRLLRPQRGDGDGTGQGAEGGGFGRRMFMVEITMSLAAGAGWFMVRQRLDEFGRFPATGPISHEDGCHRHHQTTPYGHGGISPEGDQRGQHGDRIDDRAGQHEGQGRAGRNPFGQESPDQIDHAAFAAGDDGSKTQSSQWRGQASLGEEAFQSFAGDVRLYESRRQGTQEQKRRGLEYDGQARPGEEVQVVGQAHADRSAATVALAGSRR